MGLEFWLAADATTRVAAVWKLDEALRRFRGDDGPAPDFSDLLAKFARASVDCVIVGGHAVAFHATPRATQDIDLVIRGGAAEALARFGAPANVVEAVRDLGQADIVDLAQPPLGVDILRSIDGVSSDIQAWPARVATRGDRWRTERATEDRCVR